MAEIITNPNNIQLDTSTQINYVQITSSTKSGDNLFYCNRPEPVTATNIAENDKFLCKGLFSGNGRIYTWHQNKAGGAIRHYILVNNPNSYSITVNATKINNTKVSTSTAQADAPA